MGEGPGLPRAYGRLLADVLSFGWVLPAAIAAGAGLGWLLDKAFRTFPVLTVAFALLGAIAGFRQIYREMVRISDDKPEPKEP